MKYQRKQSNFFNFRPFCGLPAFGGAVDPASMRRHQASGASRCERVSASMRSLAVSSESRASTRAAFFFWRSRMRSSFGLADAVGAVGGLVFGGGVPPGVVVDDGVGGGEIEPGAAGLERDEEDGDFAGLEFFDEFGALLGLAGEFEERDVLEFEVFLDEFEHGGELREQQDAAALLDELGQDAGGSRSGAA